MSTFRIHKVVARLPDVLDKDAVYAVRAGEGFDLYITDATGTAAHPINRPQRVFQQILSTDLDMTNGYPFSPREIPFAQGAYERPPLVIPFVQFATPATGYIVANVYAITRTGFKFRTNTKQIAPFQASNPVAVWVEIVPQ